MAQNILEAKHGITFEKLMNKTLHSSNLHKDGYNFAILTKDFPALSAFVKKNKFGKLSIDFANPDAVTALNTALLKHYYEIHNWSIPQGALCPPIPGRVDYIHHIAELLGVENKTKKTNIKMLDIGIGANGIYSLLASQIYGWQCVGSDINQASLHNVQNIIENNPQLRPKLSLRQQQNANFMFSGIINKEEYFDVSVCNPPFHASQQEAQKGSQRKINNLSKNKEITKIQNRSSNRSTVLNFGGQEAELWCNGGERLFLKKMIKESELFKNQCKWFTSLISKGENVKPSIKLIKKLGAKNVKEIEMKQGNKVTRILAWSFK